MNRFALLVFVLIGFIPFVAGQSFPVRGIGMVAPPYVFPANPMPPMSKVGANWVALHPYAYTRIGEPAVHYEVFEWQWWGERVVGIEESIRLAKDHGLQVCLKPMVYITGSWPGGLDFKTDAEWERWEADYDAYLMQFVALAVQYDVEMVCIGTEFKRSSLQRPQFWRGLIAKIRKQYSGDLVYAANWDEFQDISFWDELDYIGIDAYFPLSGNIQPTVEELHLAWSDPLSKIKKCQRKHNKPVLFTEFGYLSVDGCAGKTWELEPLVNDLPINEAAQAAAYEALFSFWSLQPFWKGGFLWKWFPNGAGHEGYPTRDYTPQDKAAERVLSKWYLRWLVAVEFLTDLITNRLPEFYAFTVHGLQYWLFEP